MAKKFTIKKLRLRARARRRKHALKTDPGMRGWVQSVEMKNVDIIRDLESKVKAAQAK